MAVAAAVAETIVFVVRGLTSSTCDAPTGAEAVITPTAHGHSIDKRERVERLKGVYAGLMRGMSPAMAVAEANALFGNTVYSCVF